MTGRIDYCPLQNRFALSGAGFAGAVRRVSCTKKRHDASSWEKFFDINTCAELKIDLRA
jgi:hypothetical protein